MNNLFVSLFRFSILFIFFSYLSPITNTASASDLDLENVLDEIMLHDDFCSKNSNLKIKIERYLASEPTLSNKNRARLLWGKLKLGSCFDHYDNDNDYINTLKEIMSLPSENVDKDILAMTVYDLTINYQLYTSKENACDLLHEKQITINSYMNNSVNYLELANISTCSTNTPINKLKSLYKLIEPNKNVHHFMIELYDQIKEIYYSAGQYSLAVKTFKEQIKYFKNENSHDLYQAYYNIANYLIYAGDFEESKIYLKKYESGKDKFNKREKFKIQLSSLKIRFAYIERNFDLMMELMDKFEPLQNITQELYQTNKYQLFKAITCQANNRKQCTEEFISQKEQLLEQTSEPNLIYLYEFLINYYISSAQNDLAEVYFKKYSQITNTYPNKQIDTDLVFGLREIQGNIEKDIIELELSLMSNKYQNSKIIIILSALLVFFLVSICIYIWLQKNKQKRLSETDELTRIFNRRAIFEQLTRLQKPEGKNVHAIILFDLDHFKLINDKYSHLAGDKLLRHIVSLTKRNVRQEDAFGRIGGEEFIVCLKNLDKNTAKLIVERIRRSFEQNSLQLEDDVEIIVTASFSITYIKKPIFKFESLYQKLDDALYQAKKMGRNKIIEV